MNTRRSAVGLAALLAAALLWEPADARAQEVATAADLYRPLTPEEHQRYVKYRQYQELQREASRQTMEAYTDMLQRNMPYLLGNVVTSALERIYLAGSNRHEIQQIPQLHTAVNSYGATYDVPYGHYDGNGLIGIEHLVRPQSGGTEEGLSLYIRRGARGRRKWDHGWSFEPGAMLQETYVVIQGRTTSLPGGGTLADCAAVTRFAYYSADAHYSFQRRGLEQLCNYRLDPGAERSAEDGQILFYHPDHLGSSTVMTGPGAVVAHRSAFKPYGEDVDTGGGGFVPKLRFNFKEKESAAVYDFGARLYNPATGRWLSPDPEMDGPNRYAYVGNNPLGFIDPSGHQKERKDKVEKVVDPVPIEVDVTASKEYEEIKEVLDYTLAGSEAMGASVHTRGEMLHELALEEKTWLMRECRGCLANIVKGAGASIEIATVVMEIGVTVHEVVEHARHGRKRQAYKAAGEGLGAVVGGVGGGVIGGALGGPAAPLTAGVGSVAGNKGGRHVGGIGGEVVYELVTGDWSRIIPRSGRSASIPPPGYFPNVPGSPVYNPAYKVCATCFLPRRTR